MSGRSLAPITEYEPPNVARVPDGSREGAPRMWVSTPSWATASRQTEGVIARSNVQDCGPES
jgi:hypothetical protein